MIVVVQLTCKIIRMWGVMALHAGVGSFIERINSVGRRAYRAA